MDETTIARIHTFLARYETLVLATADGKQPYATRIFFVEDPVTPTICTLYGTLITTSRKLANLLANPRVGLFIGPDAPSTWMEATAYTRVLDDQARADEVRAQLGRKSPTAAAFISRVPPVAVELQINWLRITDLTSDTPYTEAEFEQKAQSGEQQA